MAVNENVLQQLGPAVAEALPIVITRKAGITKHLLYHINNEINKGNTFSGLADSLAVTNQEGAYDIMHQYYAIAAKRKAALEEKRSTFSRAVIDPPPVFKIEVCVMDDPASLHAVQLHACICLLAWVCAGCILIKSRWHDCDLMQCDV